MLDIGWSEMAIILLVALIVIGPKDLPRVARTMGQWVRKGRALAREFQTSLEDMAREAELDEVKRDIERVGRTDLKRSVEKSIDPKGDLGRAFDVDGEAKKSGTGKATGAKGGAAKKDAAKPETAKAGAKASGPVEAAERRAEPGDADAGERAPAQPAEGGAKVEREKVTADTQ